jgi:archaellum component FlaC
MTEDELVKKIDNDFTKFKKDFIGKLKNEQTSD